MFGTYWNIVHVFGHYLRTSNKQIESVQRRLKDCQVEPKVP